MHSCIDVQKLEATYLESWRISAALKHTVVLKVSLFLDTAFPVGSLGARVVVSTFPRMSTA